MNQHQRLKARLRREHAGISSHTGFNRNRPHGRVKQPPVNNALVKDQIKSIRAAALEGGMKRKQFIRAMSALAKLLGMAGKAKA